MILKNLKVLHEDNHIIIVEKESNLLTQGDSSGAPTLIEKIKEYIKKKYSKPGKVYIGMVQRLDKPVSGLLVFAKTSKAAKRLNEQFQKRDVIKIYLAIVNGGNKFQNNKWHELQHYISKNDGYIDINDENHEGAKPARLKFKNISSNNKYSLLLVRLETGLKHQIRAQLSNIGCPIIGDKKYGSEQNCKDQSILLHSFYLEFTHPTTKEKIKVCSDIPERFMNLINFDDKTKEIIAKSLLTNSIMP